MIATEALAEIRRLCDKTSWILDAREVRQVLAQVDGKAADPLPPLPVSGDEVEVLFRLPKHERTDGDLPNIRLTVVYLDRDAAGLWWSPTDDRPHAEFTRWADVLEIAAAPMEGT